MRKRLFSLAIGVGAMATLGGVAMAAANSVDDRPAPAFIPGVETTTTVTAVEGSDVSTSSTATSEPTSSVPDSSVPDTS